MLSPSVHEQKFHGLTWLKIALICAHTISLYWHVWLTGQPDYSVSQIAFEFQIFLFTPCVQVDVSLRSCCSTFYSSDVANGFLTDTTSVFKPFLQYIGDHSGVCVDVFSGPLGLPSMF